ncbi:MAG: rubrerythrin [Bacteroidetes bacterium GWF2_33_16]|nr:MAG: rubrerythrin [Bacteroidetes bacterium GWE2_32_14]OFY08814.1 MAG: rubrerythrin [Bacteroidetes bacterium GWF2_33_16]
MSTLKGTRTEQNLLKAFAGESQAKNRYEFFAKQAKQDGYEQIAAFFNETALQEQQHAKTFFKFLEGGMVEITAMYPAGVIADTAENLKAAAAGENEEWTELYPEFAKIAEEEGFKQIATAFKLIAKVEAEHEKRYLKLLKNIEDGKVFERDEKVRWVCRKCGYVHESLKALKNCPVCNHPEAYFELEQTNY